MEKVSEGRHDYCDNLIIAFSTYPILPLFILPIRNSLLTYLPTYLPSMLSGEKATRALQSLVQLNVVGKKNLMVEVKVLDDDCDRQKMDIRAILQEKDRLDRDVEVFVPFSSHHTSFYYTILSYPIIVPPTKLLYSLSHLLVPFFVRRYPISDIIHR